MKKYLVLLLFGLFSFSCYAQDDVDDFFSNLLEEDVKEETEATKQNEFTARKVFQMAPKKEVLPEVKAPKINYTENVVVKKAGIERESAPFGLYWGTSMRETEENGVYLRPYTKDGEVTAYEATSLPKPIKDFAVVVDFGDSDELWKIRAFSTPKEDDLSASRVLSEYKKFYDLLEKKYGIANDKSIMPEDAEEGAEGYLALLKSGDAVKAASFSGNNVEANIEIKVLPNNYTYLILEYISKKITKAREEDILDAL